MSESTKKWPVTQCKVSRAQRAYEAYGRAFGVLLPRWDDLPPGPDKDKWDAVGREVAAADWEDARAEHGK